MYNEKSYLNYIFWTKVKRVFILLAFSVAGCFLGIFISDIVQTLTLSDENRVKIISISTTIFFAISLLITLNVSREIQNAYWKVAVLRKLTVMSKKLDNLTPEELNDLKEEFNNLELDESTHINNNEKVKSISDNSTSVSSESKNETSTDNKIIEISNNINTKKDKKNKKNKKIKNNENNSISEEINKEKRTIVKSKTI